MEKKCYNEREDKGSISDTKIQWHPGFVAAMALEFGENRGDLIYEKEYNLNTKPLEIDLLVIKKDPGVQVVNELGKLFRGHNIIEYKSPEDHLDIDSFYKTIAYGCLYKAYGRVLDERAAVDITISLVRDARPDGLFRYFRKHHVRVVNPYRGVYHIADAALFPTQIIVGKELEEKAHIWLRALSDQMKEQEMEELLKKISGLTGKLDRQLADSVLEVTTSANEQLVERMRGGKDRMSKTLLRIMKPEIDEIVEDRVQEEMRNAIKCAVKSFRELGVDDERIKGLLVKNHKLTSSEAAMYL